MLVFYFIVSDYTSQYCLRISNNEFPKRDGKKSRVTIRSHSARDSTKSKTNKRKQNHYVFVFLSFFRGIILRELRSQVYVAVQTQEHVLVFRQILCHPKTLFCLPLPYTEVHFTDTMYGLSWITKTGTETGVDWFLAQRSYDTGI